MKKSLKALIFDVDGTLSNTEADGHRVAFNRAFDEMDINWHWDVDTYGKLLAITGGKERMKYFVSDFLDKDDIPENIHALIPEIHKTKTRHYTELLSTGAIPLRTGVKRLINEAREKGLRIAIATTTTHENVTALLEHTLGKESINWFDVIAAGDIVPAKKPAPDIYEYALKNLKLNAAECIAFEDSENGILSSLAANLKTIITTNDYTLDHNFDGAAIVLNHMGEPDEKFSVSHGDANGFDHLTCEMIEAIHAKA